MVITMKYWAFEIKVGKNILINCKDIDGVYLLGEHLRYDVYSGLGISVSQQSNVTLPKTEIEKVKNTETEEEQHGADKKTKKRRKKDVVPVRPEIRAGGLTKPVHVPVSAEQRYANKLARETAIGRVVEVEDKDMIGVKFSVVRHIDGSLYLLREWQTDNEYWAKWYMKTDRWEMWSDNYSEEKKAKSNMNAKGPHRSSCCHTINRRRLANKPYCLACKDDNATQRTNRRIANGGPEANLIFDEHGQLTTAWTKRAKEVHLNRLREQEENE